MSNQEREPYVLDFPNGQRVEDILKKADANYSKAEIDQQMASKATMSDVERETQNLQNQINEIVRAKEDLCTSEKFADNKDSDTMYPTCKAVYDNTANHISTGYFINKPFNWVDNQGGGAVQISAIGHTDAENKGYMNFFIFASGAPKTFTDGYVICSDLPFQTCKYADRVGIWHPIALCGSSGILGTAYIVYNNDTKELILRTEGNIDNVTRIQGEFSIPAQFI